MPTTIVTSPNILSPVNNLYGNYFQLNNTLSSQTNFKYLTKLFINNNFAVIESQPPRPNTGIGLYSPYQSLLANLSYGINNTITGGRTASNSLVSYYINTGIEYNPGLTIATVLQVGSNFGFSFSSITNASIGDIITIQSQNPYFGGTQTVTQILNSHSFVTNLIFNATSSVSTGVITDLQRWDGTSSIYWGFNGTRQYAFSTLDYYQTYVFGLTSGLPDSQPYLTDYTTNTVITAPKYVLPGQEETLSFFLNKSGFTYSSACVTYNWYDANRNNIGSTNKLFAPTNDALQRWDIPVGPSILSTFWPASTVYWNPAILNTTPFGGGTVYSESRYYSVDTNCSLYTNVRVMWLNSLGGFDYFNFRLDDQKNYNITRTEYKQELPIPYNIGDRNRTILSQKVVESHSINTDYINQDKYQFLNSLVNSPEVYIIDELTGNPYPVILTDKQFTFKTLLRDQLMQLELNYEMSYQIETQKQ